MSELKRDEETGHLVGIEQRPVVAVAHADFPKWKFKLHTEEAEGKTVHSVQGVIVATPEEDAELGSDWSSDRAEVVKGSPLEGLRIVEKHVHLHEILNARHKAEPVEVESDEGEPLAI